MNVFEDKFEKELNRLKNFYKLSLESYSLLFDNKKVKARQKKTQYEYLFDIVIVKLVSITENYFVEVVKDLYLYFPERFLEIASSLNVDFPKILKKEDISSIHSDFLKSITRAITSGGIHEAKKTLKRVCNIDFTQLKSYKETLIYYDYRNLIVHRLGKTDEAFRIKHKTFDLKLNINEEIVEEGFKIFFDFCSTLSQRHLQIINEYNEILPRIKDSYISCILEFNDNDAKSGYMLENVFLAEDDIVRFGDLIEQYLWDNNILKMAISGTQQAVEEVRKVIVRDRNKKRINVLEFNIIQYKRPNLKNVSKEELDAIKDLLPTQPWEKGVHKMIASQLGLTNGKVSDAITILINRGEFLPQKDGKIFRI